LKKFVLASVAVVAMAATPIFAHHSYAMFDNEKVTLVRGTLLTFTYLNPHSWISVTGSVDNGPSERWDIEATAPAILSRQGIQADTLKRGDKLTVAFHPLHDGRRGGSLIFVVTPDGVAHGAKPSDFGFDLQSLKPQ
jgi:hypothetical protein